MSIFTPPSTLEESGDILAQHMPDGRAWSNKNLEETNLRGLVKGCSATFWETQKKIFELAEEFNINLTTDLLVNWEESVGIPDDCVLTADDLATRRERVIERLRKIPLVTLADWQLFVDEFFAEDLVTLRTGTDVFTFEYEFEFSFLGDVNEKFVIVADIESQGLQFEYDFEFDFEGGIDEALLNCVLRKILPGNVALIIRYVG